MTEVSNNGGRPRNCEGCKRPKTRCKCGRQTVITPQALDRLCTAFSYAFTDEEACAYAGISASSLYRYCDKNPRFRQRKEGLKMWPTIHAKMHIGDAIDSGNLKLSRWWLERKDPEFSKRRRNTNTVEPNSIAGLTVAVDRKRNS